MNAVKLTKKNKLNRLSLVLKVFFLISSECFKKFLGLFTSTSKESLSNKLALVTGGANGLGRELCMKLAAEKCDLAVVDIDIETATNTAKEIEEKFEVQCRAFECDIADSFAIKKLKEKVESEMKSVDILVNNAGLIYYGDFLKCKREDMKRVVDVNLTGQILVKSTFKLNFYAIFFPFQMTRAFLPSMKQKMSGKIVTICSMSAVNSLPFGIVYTASKFGVDGFMNALYDELCVCNLDDKIKLTTIYPDFIATREDIRDLCAEINIPFYQLLTPERVANEAIDGIKEGKRKVFISNMKLGQFLFK